VATACHNPPPNAPNTLRLRYLRCAARPVLRICPWRRRSDTRRRPGHPRARIRIRLPRRHVVREAVRREAGSERVMAPQLVNCSNVDAAMLEEGTRRREPAGFYFELEQSLAERRRGVSALRVALAATPQIASASFHDRSALRNKIPPALGGACLPPALQPSTSSSSQFGAP